MTATPNLCPSQRRPLVATIAAASLAVGLAMPTAASTTELRSYAIVQDDATLRLRGETIRLFGVLIPDDDRQCRRNLRPVRCGLNRAAVALDFLIQGFVRCRLVRRYGDGTLGGRCFTGYSLRSDGVDLGAFLIEEGLAVATPEAPFAYHALERIARAQERGVWGFTVDGIGRR